MVRGRLLKGRSSDRYGRTCGGLPFQTARPSGLYYEASFLHRFGMSGGAESALRNYFKEPLLETPL